MTPPAVPVQEATMNGTSPVEQTIAQAATETVAAASMQAAEAATGTSIDELINAAIQENQAIMNKEIEEAAAFLKANPAESLRILADFRREKGKRLDNAA
jgi:hypothetical protein